MEETITPKNNQPPTKIIPIKPHHSYDDWLFNGINWPNYNATKYITPPTSLAASGPVGYQYGGFSTLKTYTNLPEIRMVNNVLWLEHLSENYYAYFRAQAYPATTHYLPRDCYFLRFWSNNARFGVRINHTNTTIRDHTFNPPLNLDTWYKHRMSIWNLPIGQTPTMIGYRFELWENDQWKTYFEGTHSPSRWWNSTTNLFGIFLLYRGPYNQNGSFIDDTEIWIPAT